MKNTLKIKPTLYLFFLIALSACNTNKEKKETPDFKSKSEYENVMILSHQAFLKNEKLRIEADIDSVGMNFESTGTGLRYAIINENEGDHLERGDVAFISYTLTSLSGDTLYVSPEGKAQQFVVDYDDVESGLHEGIKLMKVGEEALLILPAHLAHGITGDQAAIPSQTTLVYQIKLLGKQ